MANAGSYSTNAVAQQTIAYILNHYTKISEYDTFVKDGGWQKSTVFDNSYHNRGKKEIDGITFFNVDLPKRRDYDVTFIKYLNFFTNFIYEKKLTPVAIAELRKKQSDSWKSLRTWSRTS